MLTHARTGETESTSPLLLDHDSITAAKEISGAKNQATANEYRPTKPLI